MAAAANAPRDLTELPSGIRQSERSRARQLIDNGQAAMAVISALSDTGMRVAGETVAELSLLVERPGAEPYQVTRRVVVPADAKVDGSVVAGGGRDIPRQRRRRIPVLVDPARPENLLLQWDLRAAS